jgi:DNA-binding CsgD family transcriptional regulator
VVGSDNGLHGQVEDEGGSAFFESAARQSSILLLEGEAGIGKTTQWLRIVDEARARGFQVLSARPTEAESQLAYTSLADLLRDLDQDRFDRLPPAQRIAADRVLSRAPIDESATEPTTTAAALLSLVQGLAEETPVLLALDDLQWVDRSSADAIASVSRRLPARASVLGTLRTGDEGDPASWLQPRQPSAIRRQHIGPMSETDLERLVTDRLGRTLSHSAWKHVLRVSHGNPFFALELARWLEADGNEDRQSLPDTLAEVVRTRLGDVSDDTRRALLAVASVAEPTVEIVQQAVEIPGDELLQVIMDAERRRLLEIDGNRLRFTHPLLAAGVYSGADAPARRDMHRQLASLVTGEEARARHLALAAVRGDPETLDALDSAAVTARVRGAPAAAAELLELALRLGGDDPERRLHLGQHLLDAGDAQHAREVLEQSLEQLPPGPLRARTASALAHVRLHGDSFVEAAILLESALRESEPVLPLRVEILTFLAYALLNAGEPDAALQRAEEAVAHGERLGASHQLGQALGMRLTLQFLRGGGLDETALTRALALEDAQSTVPITFRPSAQAALLHAWTGRLNEASVEIAEMRRRCLELGDEGSLVFVDFHAVLIQCWRGDFREAARVSEDAERRSRQLGGEVPHAVARSTAALVASYAGRLDDAQRDAREALDSFRRSGTITLSEVAVATLGFVEVSRGDHDAALTVLAPLLGRLKAAPEAVELIASSFVPDAVEALVALGRLEEAEFLAVALQSNGLRLDRAWLLAVGHRCRSMIEAGHGELQDAKTSAQRGMVEHDRLAMPFERARTQLVLGQIQRRLRQKEAATASLAEALATFDSLGTPLWAERCRAELARVGGGRRSDTLLTSSEQRVAELAATGMTNREVAAALFISPKTVESNLAKVYRKLDIRSRAELGRRMSQQE